MLRICLLLFCTAILIQTLSENGDISIRRKQIKILLVRAGIKLNPGPNQHKKSVKHICEYCGHQYARKYNLQKHVERFHQSAVSIFCRFCSSPFSDLDQWNEHMNTEHRPRSSRWQVSNQAFNGKIIELTQFFKEDKQSSIEKALGNQIETQVKNQLVYYRRLHGTIRFQLTIVVMMAREGPEGEIMDNFFLSK